MNDTIMRYLIVERKIFESRYNDFSDLPEHPNGIALSLIIQAIWDIQYKEKHKEYYDDIITAISRKEIIKN